MGGADPVVWRRWAEADRLLAAALELPAADREARIRMEAGDDLELRDLVLRLLASVTDDATGTFAPSKDIVVAAFSSGDPSAGVDALTAGDLVGRYRIVRQVGRGGMASVYEAERADGSYEQRVALKVLRRGLDTDDLIRRFMAERQILSSLSHPNIARLIDGGSTDSGRPYLVMELVAGEPLTAWADHRKLGLRERLGLFQHVTAAVSAAHRRLVVHRDIKPSNIMVDADGTVKLLDFGIAKLLDRDEAFTGAGASALTPEYASPEQTAGGAITTGTDVYQLGLLLRELVTGLPPRVVSPAEAERTAVRPSRLVGRELSGMGTPVERATARGTTPERLTRLLRGDLDIIIGKATRQHSAERYASVDELAADVARYLDGHAILAHPESLVYRVRKFAVRHPFGLASAAVAAMVSIAFTALLVVQNHRVVRERDTARVATARALATQQFLVDLLRTSDPTGTSAVVQNPNLTVGEALERGRERVDRELADQPEVRAALLLAMGQAFGGLGRFETADTLLRQAYRIQADIHGDSSLAVVPALTDLGDIYRVQRDFRLADSLYHLAARIRSTLPPDAFTASLLSRSSQTRRDLGDVDSAIALATRSVSLRRALGDTAGADILEGLGTLAYALRAAGRLDSAAALYRVIIERMERDSSTYSRSLSAQYNNLGFVLRTQSKYAGADSAYRAALEITEEAFGAGHVNTLLVRQNLAGVAELAGWLDEADTLGQQQVAAAEDAWPQGHWRVGSAYSALGRFRLRAGRAAEAVPPLQSAIRSYGETIGYDHEWTAVARVHLAVAHVLSGRLAPGMSAYEQAIARLATRTSLVPDSRSSLSQLATVLEQAGRVSMAQEVRALLGTGGA